MGMRATTKKERDGFKSHRLHVTDAEDDKFLCELDSEIAAAVIQTGKLTYLTLTPDQLRDIADWVERAWVEHEDWLESEEGQACLEAMC